nr:HD domain-containing phosphohydrolase [uncultured Sporomusa sp.]
MFSKFHDIGKVGIPDAILFKPARLLPEEYSIMQQHCEIGYRIAQAVPELMPIAELILRHHEWWNGGGYPLKLQGEEIPIECRILALADAYDAMTNDRPYHKAMSYEEALQELRRNAGKQFDPVLTELFIALIVNQVDPVI